MREIKAAPSAASSMLQRRQLIKMLGATAFLTGVSGCGGSAPVDGMALPPSGTPGAEGGDAGRAIDFTPPEGWDYPAVIELLPFGHGVASGDPLADRVILWTRVTVPDADGWRAQRPQGLEAVDVRWVIATDPALTDIVGGGTVRTTRALDWTVKVDASGLSSATTYYYAFGALGCTSIVGRTRTAPAPGDAVDALRIAHAACTSYWSMDFHPYSRIAERDDLDLFCHAGDHVYEFVDTKGWYRARNDRFDLEDVDFRKWFDAEECGRRYALYYSDPDLLKAHQSLPFAIMPDQHDLDDETNPETGVTFTEAEAAQVFWLWTPSRPPLPDGSGAFGPAPSPDDNIAAVPRAAATQLYRALPYGDLGEVLLIDIRRHRDPEAPTALEQLLGIAQTAWLKVRLLDSAQRGVTHRVIVNQINLSQLRVFNAPVPGIFETLGLDPDGPELYTSGWGGLPEARDQLYAFLRDNGIVDNVVMSGDSHGWFASDLVETSGLPAYEPLTGGGTQGVVGVEIVPSAFGRPGGGEVVAGALYEAANGRPVHEDYENYRRVFVPMGNATMRLVEPVAQLANPNLRYFNWRTYGYGLAHLTDREVVCELWEVPAPVRSDAQTLIRQFRSAVGRPHLARDFAANPTSGLRAAVAPGAEPAPASDRLTR
ncbi:MAG: alkaline phosphatase D family protein [Algiphilus sp.]